MANELIMRSKSYDHDGGLVEVCINFDRGVAMRLADKAAKSSNGRARDGALTAAVSPEYRKQTKESYRRWRMLAARREDAILRLFLHISKEHDLDV
ncbi:MAG: hypothetical protein ACR2JW_15185 [Thermomicrobiales bacterium]